MDVGGAIIAVNVSDNCRDGQMLDPWIIEEIRKREDLDQRDERPVLEIPVICPEDEDQKVQEEEEVERGVVIVDFKV
jgi:hypothetical protein